MHGLACAHHFSDCHFHHRLHHLKMELKVRKKLLLDRKNVFPAPKAIHSSVRRISMSWLKKWERQKRQQKMRRLTTSPTKRIKREVLRFFYRPSKVLAYCPTSNDESTSTYYVRNQSIDDTRKAHKLINVISREQTWTSEKWRTINILDDLRIKFNKNGSLIDTFSCQYPRSRCKDGSTMVGRSDFQQVVSRTYRLPPGKTVEKFMNELYDSFLVLGEFDKCCFVLRK